MNIEKKQQGRNNLKLVLLALLIGAFLMTLTYRLGFVLLQQGSSLERQQEELNRQIIQEKTEEVRKKRTQAVVVSGEIVAKEGDTLVISSDVYGDEQLTVKIKLGENCDFHGADKEVISVDTNQEEITTEKDLTVGDLVTFNLTEPVSIFDLTKNVIEVDNILNNGPAKNILE